MLASTLSVVALLVLAAAPDGSSSPTPEVALRSGLAPAPASPRDASTGLPRRVIHTASGIEMVLVPAGEVWTGRSDGEGDKAKRLFRVEQPFYIAVTEVTVEQFRRFVDATAYRTDAERGTPEEPDKSIGGFAQTSTLHHRAWDTRSQWRLPFPQVAFHQHRDDHPVTQVSWNDAAAFARHFELALPTEAQWVRAQRLGLGITDPHAPPALISSGGSNLGDRSTAARFATEPGMTFDHDDGFATLAPVRSGRPDALGLYEMNGNVEEWTADLVDERDKDKDPDRASRTLRGSAWFGGPPGDDGTARFGIEGYRRRDFIGFRVVVDALRP